MSILNAAPLFLMLMVATMDLVGAPLSLEHKVHQVVRRQKFLTDAGAPMGSTWRSKLALTYFSVYLKRNHNLANYTSWPTPVLQHHNSLVFTLRLSKDLR